MAESLASTVLFYGIVGWIATAILSYAGIRAYLNRRGEPVGWRFNHHGARAIPGHLSFYELDGGHAIVLKPIHVCPLFWKVKRTPEPGAYLNPEIAKRGPVWSVVPWAFDWMDNYTVISWLNEQ